MKQQGAHLSLEGPQEQTDFSLENAMDRYLPMLGPALIASLEPSTPFGPYNLSASSFKP